MDVFEIVLCVTCALWTFFRASVWVYWRKSAQLERLFEALEVGVITAWTQVVKPYWEKNGGTQPLPADIRARAEEVAVAAASRVDPIVKRFPKDVIRATLKMAVEESKRRGGK
jgi:hypothetical protein